jgi:hypothetical protein
MALLAPRPEYFYEPFHADSHLELMSSISSNPDILDIIDDHLDGQLWEDIKEFISANPDILDRLDVETLAGLVDWWKKAKKKAGKMYRSAKNKIMGKKTKGDETSDEETDENQPATATTNTRFGTTIRGCRTIHPAELTHLKLTIMQDPDVLDDMNAHLHDGLWQEMKGVFAADPALIHHLPCMDGKWMDKIKKKVTGVIHRDPHGLRNMSTDDIRKLAKEKKKLAEQNREKHEARREAEEALEEYKKSKKYTRGLFQPSPEDTIGIRVPVYGGDGRLSASILERYSK